MNKLYGVTQWPLSRLAGALALAANLLLSTSAPAQNHPCAAGGDNRAQTTNHCQRDGSPASHPNADPTTGSGLSIDLVSGNKYLEQVDAVWPGGLQLIRHYNSLNRFEQSMGPGWRHGFDTVLALGKVGASSSGDKTGGLANWQAQIVQADGRRIVFREVAAPPGATKVERQPVLAALNPMYGAIRVQPGVSPDRRYRWHWRDGSSLYFSERGHLTASERSNGQLLKLRYANLESHQKRKVGAIRLRQVTNRHGQSLKFFYSGERGLLTRVVMPDQSSLRYQYDSNGVLSSVKRQEKARWTFDYADEHFSALTSVRDAKGRLHGVYRYNGQGRAVFSSPTGKPTDPLAISIRYQLPMSIDRVGISVVTDAQRRMTRYRWRYDPRSQSKQLLSSQGPGCRVCPVAGHTRTYDNAGRPSTLKNTGGATLRRWQYDSIGRLSRITRMTGAIGRRHPITTRYTHANDAFDAPIIRIERDSVAPGRLHRLSLRYDPLGQLVQVIETGFAPDTSSLVPVAGKRRHRFWKPTRWHRIRREIQYRYVAHGRAQGLLASIDGPLEGTQDLIMHRYDNVGRLVQIDRPGGQQISFRYDSYGRLILRRADNGLEWRYARSDDWSDVRVNHRGVVIRQRFDIAGRQLETARSDRPALQMTRDPAGELVKLTNSEGKWLTQYALGLGPARVIMLSPPVARAPETHKIIHSGSAAIRVRRRGANESEHHLIDDFGRAVAVIDSATGISRWVFDGADRIVASVSHAGNAHPAQSPRGNNPALRLYRYDTRGNLTGIVDQDGPLLKNEYANGFLSRQEQRHQVIKFSENGANKSHYWSVTYRDTVSGTAFNKPLKFGREFDVNGRLSRRLLPGGWLIHYRWTHANRLTDISLVSPQGARTPLATDLQWLPFTGGRRGLLSADFGNGTRQRIRLGKQLKVRQIHNNKDLPVLTLTYDALGRVSSQQIDDAVTTYQYNKKNQLISWRSGRNGNHAVMLKNATEQPSLSQNRWVTDRAGRVRWTLDSKRRVSRYVYNLQGLRIGKIDIRNHSRSRWFIYDKQRLLMETNGDGEPLAVYLYLDGRPFVLLRYSTPGAVKPYWIHTDHRGLPLAVSDTTGRQVWRGRFGPFGVRREKRKSPDPVRFGPPAGRGAMAPGYPGNSGQDEFMPLRLPGQYIDSDTGLHDNYFRTYNPHTGKYLGPDPMGMRDGVDRFDYANRSPMGTTDPLGLYEIDVHYYMTYFLARMAGIGHTDADVIAHATQGIDDNPLTRPIDQGQDAVVSPGTPFVNQQRLLTYHFVLYDEIKIGGLRIIFNDPFATTANPQSAQLDRLRQSVSSANNGCTQMQLLGEMLHAYEDTYAHRDRHNVPIPGLNTVSLGVGHLIHGHYPDYTYNANWLWRRNEERTWQMEQDTYQRLLEYGNSDAAISPARFESAVRAFNNTPENHETGFDRKLAILDQFLHDNGIMVETPDGLRPSRFSFNGPDQPTVQYDEQNALLNRSANLCGQTYRATGTIRPRC